MSTTNLFRPTPPPGKIILESLQMRYTSTRSAAVSASFEQAICSGYAPDGGLFVPERLPDISVDDLKAWSVLSLPELSERFLRCFISQDEVPDVDLHRICSHAFSGFEDPRNAVPVVQVGSLFVAELFHGPTFCFKDLGMQIMIHLLSYFCSKRQKKMSLVVSTTGDTGPAAVQAVKDVGNPLLTILVHYPHNQISEFQRKQLTTVDSKFVRIAAFEGGGDDMDKVIKNMLARPSEGAIWTGVNSYNICRPLMQTVHYIWTYLRVLEQQQKSFTDPLPIMDVILPTGAMGNIVAGYIGMQMKLPIRKLVAGVNVNDIVHRAFSAGDFSKSNAMLKTLSEAINIQIPYNFERLLFYLTGQNHDLVRQWMHRIESENALLLPTEWLDKLQNTFSSARVTDDELCETIRRVHSDRNYWIDPHTAVAFCAADKLGYTAPNGADGTLAMVLATASPCKFREAVETAVGKDGWNAYLAKGFPDAAKQTVQRQERAFDIYAAEKGSSLEENQVRWERAARHILQELQSL